MTMSEEKDDGDIDLDTFWTILGEPSNPPHVQEGSLFDEEPSTYVSEYSFSDEEPCTYVSNSFLKNDFSPRNDVEMRNSLHEGCNDLDDSQVNEYKELSYKLFQFHTYELRFSNGGIGCPFCDYKEEHENHYIHLLLHAVRVGEEGSESGKKRANHLAMSKYLVNDLGDKVKEEADRISRNEDGNRLKRKSSDGDCSKREQEALSRVHELERMIDEMKEQKAKADRFSWGEDGKKLKRPRPDEDNSKREKGAFSSVDQLETKIDEMRDEMNALITKERSSNNELVAARMELLKLLENDHNSSTIGIKRIGELDSKVFIDKMRHKMRRRKQILPGDVETKGLELCTSWQEKIKDPNWHPFHIVEDDNGIPQRVVKEDDITLQALKKEWGVEIHDAVVKALTEIREYNPSGCYVVPELWNFMEDRKAALDEAIRHISRLFHRLKRLN